VPALDAAPEHPSVPVSDVAEDCSSETKAEWVEVQASSVLLSEAPMAWTDPSVEDSAEVSGAGLPLLRGRCRQ